MDNKPVVQSANKLDTLKALLHKGQHSLASVLPKHMTADRMVKLATVAASRDPKLLDCDPMSVLRALMDASQVGLEPFTPIQHCYIIPYFNGKKRVMEAQFQVGYRGLIELVRRSDKIISIESHCVYENDEFECVLGMNSTLMHKPNWDGDRGKMKLVYAVCKMKDGGCQFDVMGRNDVEKIRQKSKSPDSGPWKEFFDEMAKKTILKRLIKTLPISIETQKAISLDNKAEGYEGSSDIILEMETPELPAIEVSQVEVQQSIQEKAREESINEMKRHLNTKINESNLDNALKVDLRNKLVVVTDKKGIEEISSILMLHMAPN